MSERYRPKSGHVPMHLESRDVTPGWRVYGTAGSEGQRRGKISVGGGQDHALAQVRSFRQGADDRQRAIRLAPGSVFETWAGGPETMVNSLHGQGVNRLAAGLEPMAHAPDGVVEAFGVRGARTFAYAVQFHPEWRCWETPFYAAIFEAFGRACRSRSSLRLQAVDLARSAASSSA